MFAFRLGLCFYHMTVFQKKTNWWLIQQKYQARGFADFIVSTLRLLCHEGNVWCSFTSTVLP